MSYCPKCGNKVDETMAFCPHCGTSLKSTALGQPTPVPPYPKSEKQEKREESKHSEKGENQEKRDYSFAGYLIGGLVLIVFGLFSALSLTGYFTAGQGWAIMLVLIGIIIIIGAIYIAMTARKRNPKPQ